MIPDGMFPIIGVIQRKDLFGQASFSTRDQSGIALGILENRVQFRLQAGIFSK